MAKIGGIPKDTGGEESLRKSLPKKGKNTTK